MFKRFFKKSRLFSLLLALPIVGMALTVTPLQSSPSAVKEQSLIQDEKKEELNTLSILIIERLQLAHDSAIYKWNNTLPIDAPEQEEAFLLSILNQAQSTNVETSLVSQFFAAQLEAAKMVHIEDFEGWVNGNIHKHAYTPDLMSLEKKLQDIDHKLFIAFKEHYASLSPSEQNAFKIQLMKTLQEQKFSRDVIDSVTHF
jgi:chorismate mutase-like protein